MNHACRSLLHLPVRVLSYPPSLLLVIESAFFFSVILITVPFLERCKIENMENIQTQKIIERLGILEGAILGLPGRVDALVVARLAGVSGCAQDFTLTKKERELIEVMRQVDSDETFLGEFLKGVKGKKSSP